MHVSYLWAGTVVLALCPFVSAQSLGGAGAIDGVVTDPSGAVIPNATVAILNRITGYERNTSTDPSGNFKFANVPPNSYHLEVLAPGFEKLEEHVTVRSSLPLSLKLN